MDDSTLALGELTARVERLEDEREITLRFTRYGFAVDMGDADATEALYTDDTFIDLGPTVQFHGAAGARQLVLNEIHQAIVGRCAHTMGPFVVDVAVDGDRASATGYVRVDVSDADMRNPRLWRIGYTKFELVRGTTWRIATRTSRSLGEDEGASLLKGGL